MRRVAPLLAAALALAGCSRCGAPRVAEPPERHLPAEVAGALVVTDLGEAARQAAALLATLSALPGGSDLASARTALGAQLSFDPLDPASIEGAGLDPRRGAAVAELPPAVAGRPGPALLALPVGDAARLDALVARLARERLGASERGQENANGRPIDVWRRAPGEPSLLAAVRLEGTLLLSAGPGGPDALRAALALDPALSLERSPAWQRARAALGPALPALFWLPPASPALSDAPPSEGLAAGLSAGARSARLVAALMLGGQESRLRPLAGPGAGRAGPSPLDPSTVLAARVSASPGELARLLLDERGGGERAIALRAVAEALEPGLDVGVGLSPQADLAAALAGRGAGDPLRVARGELVATARDAAAMPALLDRLARAAGGDGGDGRWRVPAGRAEVAFALRGRTLAAAAGPPGGLDALLARLGGPTGFTAPTPASAAALAGGLGGAVLHAANLARAVKALPPEAYGSGPDAVVARSLAERLVAPAGPGGAVSLRADLPAGALRLAVEVELGEPPPAAAP